MIRMICTFRDIITSRSSFPKSLGRWHSNELLSYFHPYRLTPLRKLVKVKIWDFPKRRKAEPESQAPADTEGHPPLATHFSGTVDTALWWTWDARLTSTLVLWLIYVAYLLLRRFAAGSNLSRSRPVERHEGATGSILCPRWHSKFAPAVNLSMQAADPSPAAPARNRP
jgi:hypothetical protein